MTDGLNSNEIREVQVALARLETATTDTNRRLDTIEQTLKSLQANSATMVVLVNRVDMHENRILSLESNFTWGTRLVLGAVFLAVLGLIFTTGSPKP
jgi:flagellin-like hook-associated protein FlgL